MLVSKYGRGDLLVYATLSFASDQPEVAILTPSLTPTGEREREGGRERERESQNHSLPQILSI